MQTNSIDPFLFLSLQRESEGDIEDWLLASIQTEEKVCLRHICRLVTSLKLIFVTGRRR